MIFSKVTIPRDCETSQLPVCALGVGGPSTHPTPTVALPTMGVELTDEHVYDPAGQLQVPVTWIDMQNYRDPPPYPGHSKQVFTNQPGFRQSFSGSETSTDVSLSSTENLATSQRQEPQGEETVQTSLYSNTLDFGAEPCGGSYSILARLGMPSGALEGGKVIVGGGGGGGPGLFSTTASSLASLPSSSSSSMSSQSAAYLMQQQHHHHHQQQHHQHQQQQQQNQLTSAGTVGVSPLTSQGHLTVPGWAAGSVGHGMPGGFSNFSSNFHPGSENNLLAVGGAGMVSRDLSELRASGGGGGGGGAVQNYSSTLASSSASHQSRYDRHNNGAAAGLGGLAGTTTLSSSSSSSSLSHSQQYNLSSPRGTSHANPSYHHRHPYVNQTPWSSGGSDDSTSTPVMIHNPGNSSSSSSMPPPPSSSTSSSSSSTTTRALMNPPPEYPGPPSSSSSSSSSSRLLRPSSSSSSSENNATPHLSHDPLNKPADIRTCRSYEAMDKVDRCQQRSHPDLRLCCAAPAASGAGGTNAVPGSPRGGSGGSRDEGEAKMASQMVSMLSEQNRVLREDLAVAAVKVKKLHKLELEIHKVHESHEGLVKSSQKQEALWQAMKRQLENRIRTLEAAAGHNSDHSGSNQNLSNPGVSEAEHRAKLAEKDAMISKLLSQNQGLSSHKDQLDLENAQFSLTVSEHKAHVDILEAALLNAQSKVLALEEDYSTKQAYAEKVKQLQEALTSMQASRERQERNAQEMRVRLEKELEMYRAQDKSGAGTRPEAAKEDGKSIGMLRKMLDEKDGRISQLETQLSGLEQKYVKETTLRQLHMDEKSQAPKEVRLAALEKSSSDMERMIDEAKTEKLKHMEELHQSQRKIAELEAKVKQLKTQLVEKEAMVKVFQRAPMARSSSLHALCHSTIQRPGLLGSSHTSAWQGAGSSPHREFTTIRHMKTGSTSAIEMGRKMSVEEDLLSKVQSLGRSSETKSDSEEEMKLWQV